MPLFRRRGKGGDTAADASQKNIAPAGLHESQPLVDDDDDDDSSEPPLPKLDKETTAKAQAVMKDHLTIMRDVVMKIRHQEGYAKAMYANCPRLQHLLERNPDLRPVFEDPRLVRINFETVYKEAGGILPEDEEEEERKKRNPSLIVRIANHPIFKFLKVLIFVKKIIGCIAGGGIALVSSCWHCLTDCCTDCCCEDAVEEVGEVDLDSQDEYGLDPDAPLDENQKALNTAADYMEDPEVQEQMQRLLEDPENLEDAIENDAELRALRDSNPLCAELMQDPETMKILTDPDNLRALGEAPHMIELDFTDPNGFTPEADFVEDNYNGGDSLEMDASMDDIMDASGSMDGLEAYDADYDENEIMFDMGDDPNDLEMGGDGDDGIQDDSLASFQDEPAPEEDAGITWAPEDMALELEAPDLELDGGVEVEVEVEVEAEADAAAAEQQTTTQTSNWEDDFEMEQQDVDVDGDAADANAAGKGKGKGAANQKRSAAAEEANKKGGMAGLVASFGVAATDVIASQIVGEVFGSDLLPGDFLSGGDMGPDLGGFEAAADQADGVVNDDVAGIAEDTVDDVDDEKDGADKEKQRELERQRSARQSIDETGRKKYIGLMAPGLLGATAVGAAGLGPMKEEDEEDSLDDGLQSIGEEDEEEPEQQDKFDDEQPEEEAEDDGESKKPKSKIFGAFKNLASATVTAAKEQMVGALLGDDLAELIVEKQEESSSDDSSSSSSDEEDGEKKEKKKGRFRKLFGRKTKDPEESFNIQDELLQSFKVDDLDELESGELPQVSDSTNTEQSFVYGASASKYGQSFGDFADQKQHDSDFYGQSFAATPEDEVYDPNFYKNNPEYVESEQPNEISEQSLQFGHTSTMNFEFEANSDEEEYDPNFYQSNPEYIQDDDDDLEQGNGSDTFETEESSSNKKRGFFR